MTKPYKIQVANVIRDSTHNYIPEAVNESDDDIYFTRLKYFLGLMEGSRNEAYLDGYLDPDNSTQYISAAKFYSLDEDKQKIIKEAEEAKDPITTVGIGANLELRGILDHFDKVIGQTGFMKLVYYGKAELTDQQVALIFKDCIDKRLIEIKKEYGNVWYKLKTNEQITVISLYFNSRSLAGSHTNFYKHLKNYTRTNDEKYLKMAVEEVSDRSNRTEDKGLQNRRDAEADLLASYKSPTYTKPNQSPEDVKIKIAEMNKTIIPLSGDKPIY